MIPAYKRALIVGVGNGLSALLTRLLTAEGLRVGLDKLSGSPLKSGRRSQDGRVEAGGGRGFVRSYEPCSAGRRRSSLQRERACARASGRA